MKKILFILCLIIISVSVKAQIYTGERKLGAGVTIGAFHNYYNHNYRVVAYGGFNNSLVIVIQDDEYSKREILLLSGEKNIKRFRDSLIQVKTIFQKWCKTAYINNIYDIDKEIPTPLFVNKFIDGRNVRHNTSLFPKVHFSKRTEWNKLIIGELDFSHGAINDLEVLINLLDISYIKETIDEVISAEEMKQDRIDQVNKILDDSIK